MFCNVFNVIDQLCAGFESVTYMLKVRNKSSSMIRIDNQSFFLPTQIVLTLCREVLFTKISMVIKVLSMKEMFK